MGNWLGVNSTVRFSDHWSLFGPGEVRFWEVASNLNETLFRIAGHHDINQIAMVGLGYVRVDTWPYDDGGQQFNSTSNLQLGLLWQARSAADLFRLQFYYTHNFDLRK